ncbi:MAG: FAD-dependent oxidoreductase [Desulfobulbia bacterium]
MRFSKTIPSAIALCANEADVQRCMEWVNETNTPFAVRSGGHNYAGYSSSRGLQIDVSQMKSLVIDKQAGEIELGAGNRGTDVGPILEPRNIMFPMGRCPAVAVSGLTLGGGWSMYARNFGMVCDSLVETTIVTPDAKVRTCSSSENADLFWGLRGGGGGNFGINTSFRFKTVDVSTTSAFKVLWLFPQKPSRIMQALLDIAIKAPREFSLEAIASPATAFSPRGILISVAGHMFGSESQVRQILDAAFSVEKPLNQKIQQGSFWQSKEMLSDSSPFGLFRHKSAFAGSKTIDQSDMDRMMEWLNRWPATSQIPDAAFGFYSFGGKVNDVKSQDTAFVHRNSEVLFKFATTWGPNDPTESIGATSAWLENFFEDSRPILSPFSYQNFPDPDLDDWASAYYGENLRKLMALKQKYDPKKLFTFPQSIPYPG